MPENSVVTPAYARTTVRTQKSFKHFKVLAVVFFHRPPENEIQLLPREILLLFEAVLFIGFGVRKAWQRYFNESES